MKGFLKELRVNWIMFLMILPAVGFFILFSYLPMPGIILAFKKFGYTEGIFGSPWVGLDNFMFLFRNSDLGGVLRNTVLYNIAFMILGTTTQLVMAMFLSEIPWKRYIKVTQTLMFLPYFVSFVIVGVFCYNLFGYEYGAINTILKGFGLEPFNAYQTVWVWPFIIIFFNIWKGLGYGTLIYTASIAAIGQEMYESADIDCANKWQQAIYIALPQLIPTIIILWLLNLGGILRGQFELFYNIIGENGQLFPYTNVLDTFVFRSLTKTFDIGRSAAAGFFQSVVGFFLVILTNWLVRIYDTAYALF